MKVVFVVSTLLLAQVSAVVEPEQASSQGAVEASNRSAEAARRAAADRGAAEPKESKRDRATEALEAANASFDRAVDKAERALHKVQSFAEGVRHACKNETGAQVAARDIEERVQHEVEAKNLSIAEHAKLLKDKYYSSRREHKKLGRGLEKEAREAARDVLKAGGELKHAAIEAKVAEHEYEHVYMHAEKRSEELSLAAELAGESSEVDAERLFDMVEHSIEKSASLLRQRAKEEAKKDAEEKAAAKKEAKEDAKKDAEEKAAAEKEAKEEAKKDAEEKAAAKKEAKEEAKRDAEEKAAAKKVSEADAEKDTVGERRKVGSNKEAKAGKEVESDSRRNASDQLLELPAAAEVLLAQAARPNSSAVDDAKERYQRSLDAAERAISEAGSFAEDFKHAESNTTRIQTLTEQLKHVAREQAEAKNLSLEKRADALKEAFYSDRRAHLNASRGLMRGARALAGEVMKTGLELKAALRAAGGSEREYERVEERAERDSERVEERAERVLEPVQDDIEDLYEKVGERVEEAVDQLHHEEAKRAKEAKKARETVEAEEEKEAKEAKKAEEAKEANEAKGARAAEAKGAAKSAQSAGGRRPSRASFLALPAGATAGEQTFVALSCAALAAVAVLAAKTSGPCARRTVRMDVPALG